MDEILSSVTGVLAMVNFETVILVVIVIVLLFGGARIPQLMRDVGKGINEFKEGVSEGKQRAQPDAPVAAEATAAEPPESAETKGGEHKAPG